MENQPLGPSPLGGGVISSSQYTTGLRNEGKKLKKWQQYLFRGIWLFHGYLLVRLTFSGGGIMDFYDKQQFLKTRHDILHQIIRENESLVEGIKLIKEHKGHQRELVREHLGFIAEDEYLVLFAEERELTSR